MLMPIVILLRLFQGFYDTNAVTQAKDRDQGTAALSGYAVSKGCQIVRVHNVDANRDIVKTISGIL